VSARRRVLTAATLVALALAGCTEADGPAPEPTPTSAETNAATVDLTFGVYGSADEVAGYDDMVTEFNSLDDDTQVEVVSWRDHDEALAALSAGDSLPDVFLVSRRDLAQFQTDEQVQPVDELLDARGVDFGDGYSRDALRAFSLDNRLQCMPYGISPMVIYYNTELIDFAKMRARGISAPGSDDPEAPLPTRWSFDQFAAAAEFGTKPRKRSRGVSIEASLRGLTPFIVSGGGTIFTTDDDGVPTSLALSEESSRSALETTLSVLRNAQITLSPEQLERQPALDYFKEGRLAMMAGFRDLVPDLRKVQGLEFDVMPMPILETSGTIGDITGLCLAAGTKHTPEAADFLAHAVDEVSVTAVARAGYLVPANVAVAQSDDFLQSGRLPANSGIFNTAIRDIYIPPLLASWTALEEAIAPEMFELLDTPLLPPETIEEITTLIDEESRLILDPDAATPSPSE
jgi:multiple sugar transport system substrate-binding protein